MKTLTTLALVVLLAGCATTHPLVLGAPQDVEDRCRMYANTDFSTAEKALIYASNVVVLPVSAALTLGFGTMFVYPKSVDEAWGWRYNRCLAKAGYK